MRRQGGAERSAVDRSRTSASSPSPRSGARHFRSSSTRSWARARPRLSRPPFRGRHARSSCPSAVRRGGLRFLAEPLGVAAGALHGGRLLVPDRRAADASRPRSPPSSPEPTPSSFPMLAGDASAGSAPGRGGGSRSRSRWLGIYLLQGKLPDRWTLAERPGRRSARSPSPFRSCSPDAPRRATAIRLALGATQIVVATVCFAAIAALRGELPQPRRAVGARPGSPPSSRDGWRPSLAFLVQAWAQGIVPSGHVAICFANEPLFAAAISIAFFGDRLPTAGMGRGGGRDRRDPAGDART